MQRFCSHKLSCVDFDGVHCGILHLKGGVKNHIQLEVCRGIILLTQETVALGQVYICTFDFVCLLLCFHEQQDYHCWQSHQTFLNALIFSPK